MSVIVRSLGANHMDVYVKGAPEKIASRCLPDTCKYLRLGDWFMVNERCVASTNVYNGVAARLKCVLFVHQLPIYKLNV